MTHTTVHESTTTGETLDIRSLRRQPFLGAVMLGHFADTVRCMVSAQSPPWAGLGVWLLTWRRPDEVRSASIRERHHARGGVRRQGVRPQRDARRHHAED